MKDGKTGIKGIVRVRRDIRGMPTMLEPIPMPTAEPALSGGGKSSEKSRKMNEAEVAAVSAGDKMPMEMPPMLEPIPMPPVKEEPPE